MICAGCGVNVAFNVDYPLLRESLCPECIDAIVNGIPMSFDLDNDDDDDDNDDGDKPENGKEPTMQDIKDEMNNRNLDFYNARELLRERAYGGKPPDGHTSWGDYWKSY